MKEKGVTTAVMAAAVVAVLVVAGICAYFLTRGGEGLGAGPGITRTARYSGNLSGTLTGIGDISGTFQLTVDFDAGTVGLSLTPTIGPAIDATGTISDKAINIEETVMGYTLSLSGTISPDGSSVSGTWQVVGLGSGTWSGTREEEGAPHAEGTLEKFEADSAKGFYWPYYLYVPGSLQTPDRQGEKTYLWVEPNNTGYPSDDYQVHDNAAKMIAKGWSQMAESLGTPLLVPTFPRPETEWWVLTQTLDRDTLLTQIEGLERIDLQLIAMIEDAAQRLAQQGINVEEKVIMTGFSASGMFVSRFAALHPELVQAAAAGGHSWPIAPVAEWEGVKLRYPIGVSDLKEITGKEFDVGTFKSVPIYLYRGEEDTNDSVPNEDAWDPEDTQLIFQYFGDTPVKRWPKAEEMYKSVGCSTQFVLYPGVGHTITPQMEVDIQNFLLTYMLS